MRMIHETYSWKASTFLTLTYNEEHRPGEVKKEEVQNYVKRLRRYIEPAKCMYFACGEYGSKYGREHYHAILFGLHHQLDVDILAKAWQGRGFISTGSVTVDSCRYVADYVQKTILDSIWKEVDRGEKARPFSLKSGGIGKRYCLANREKFSQRLTCNFEGFEVSLPRYYCQKLEIPQSILDEKREEKMEEHWKKIEKRGQRLRHTREADIYVYEQGKARQEQAERVINRAAKGVL